MTGTGMEEDHNQEHHRLDDEDQEQRHQIRNSQTVRFVDDEDGCIQVKENFIGFRSMDDSTGKGLTQLFLNVLNENKIKLQDCCSQGYDNGANMKGRKSGFQATILALNPRAFFMPCGCHSLSLVVSDAESSSLDSVSLWNTAKDKCPVFSINYHVEDSHGQCYKSDCEATK
ncbi:zinc finger MYM-type protein 1-like isoform X2 [Eretmochelys imbricata]